MVAARVRQAPVAG